VAELLEKKIDGDKIVIGKPLSFKDAYEGHGYISDLAAYGEWIGDFYEKRQKEEDISERWNGGVMYWQVHTKPCRRSSQKRNQTIIFFNLFLAYLEHENFNTFFLHFQIYYFTIFCKKEIIFLIILI
jgi:hypothetical protein